MAAYNILAKVDQIVTKEVMLLVEAGSPEDAVETAKTVLADYPAPVDYDPMVHRIVTRSSKYWIPRSIDFVSVEEDDEAT